MTDRRLIPANGRVAAARLQGTASAARFVEGEPRRISAVMTDLCRMPGGPRDRQLVFGDAVTVYEDRLGHSFVEAGRDGYVGYIATDTATAAPDPNHWVAVPASHRYTAPDIKSPEVSALVFGSQVCVTHEGAQFFEIDGGYFVPKPHLWPIGKRFSDPVTVAQLHFGVPYLWGGNTIQGIDCSGLVQAALLAAGQSCPGDSDLQEAALGQALDKASPRLRGDLLFWRGHVALFVDPDTLIHANARHMAVAYEPAAAAIARIDATGGGPVTSHRRL